MRLPNGFGSVHKLSGKRRNPWRARVTTKFDKDGKQQYHNVGYYETRAQALTALTEYHKNPYEPAIKEEFTFDELFNLWYESTASSKPLKEYLYMRKYTASLDAVPFAKIKPLHLQRIIDNIDKGRPTKARVKQLFSHLYNYAMKNEWYPKNNALLINLPPTKDTSRKPFTFDEIQNIINKVDESPHYEIVMMLIFSGFRIQEILKMKTTDIDFEKGVMIGGSKTKAGKNRVVPISEHIRGILHKWYVADNELLIQSNRGYSYKTHLAFWHNNISNHRPHDTRHTFITLATHANVSSIYLKKIVGHSNNDLTADLYTHTNIETLRVEMAKFDAYARDKLCIK